MALLTFGNTLTVPLFLFHILIILAYAAWKFAFQFLGRQNVEFIELAKAVKADNVASALLDRIKNVIRKEAYTEGRVLDTILEYPHLVKDLYKDFEAFHRPNGKVTTPHFNEELWARIRKTVMGDLDQQIFKAFLTFNQHILKTNFYKSEKLALSFRLDPRFLSATYPVIPFGMFFVVGAEFRGFHVRFRYIHYKKNIYTHLYYIEISLEEEFVLFAVSIYKPSLKTLLQSLTKTTTWQPLKTVKTRIFLKEEAKELFYYLQITKTNLLLPLKNISILC